MTSEMLSGEDLAVIFGRLLGNIDMPVDKHIVVGGAVFNEADYRRAYRIVMKRKDKTVG